jgi:NTE family protein
VLDPPREDMVIFQIDLFSAKGCMPKTLFDITQREKEIRYSSRTRLNTDIFRDLQTIRRTIRHLRSKVPQELRDNPDWQLPRQRELRCRDHDRIAHSPARSLLDAI